MGGALIGAGGLDGRSCHALMRWLSLTIWPLLQARSLHKPGGSVRVIVAPVTIVAVVCWSDAVQCPQVRQMAHVAPLPSPLPC